MSPAADHILLNAIGTLTTSVGPEVTTSFGQGQLGLIAVLMVFAAAEYDTAADTAARENREMRALFAEATRTPIGLDEAFHRTLRDAAETTDPDLRVRTLNHSNAELKTLLLRLHEHLEARTGEQVHALENRLWRFLRASAEARALSLPQLG